MAQICASCPVCAAAAYAHGRIQEACPRFAGSVIRVELLPGPRVFDLVIAAVLLPLGAWLALTRPPRQDQSAHPPWRIPVPAI
jgi:hypothetical protein